MGSKVFCTIFNWVRQKFTLCLYLRPPTPLAPIVRYVRCTPPGAPAAYSRFHHRRCGAGWVSGSGSGGWGWSPVGPGGGCGPPRLSRFSLVRRTHFFVVTLRASRRHRLRPSLCLVCPKPGHGRGGGQKQLQKDCVLRLDHGLYLYRDSFAFRRNFGNVCCNDESGPSSGRNCMRMSDTACSGDVVGSQGSASLAAARRYTLRQRSCCSVDDCSRRTLLTRNLGLKGC